MFDMLVSRKTYEPEQTNSVQFQSLEKLIEIIYDTMTLSHHDHKYMRNNAHVCMHVILSIFYI